MTQTASHPIKLGILIDLYNIESFDPARPNPGIGGAQYASLCVAELLSREFDLTLFTDRPIQFSGIKMEPVSGINSLRETDFLIVSVSNFNEAVDRCPARIIAWAHNTKDPRLDRLATRADRVIVISGPQYDLLRWHRICNKMQVIPYPFDPQIFEFESRSDDYIVYLGALVAAKGFHHYAAAIPEFLSTRKTKLLVIGGSQTYGNTPEGRLRVTSSEYENQFWKNVEPFVASGQVRFLGNLGTERFTLISRAKLALTNPTGASETFCISNYECMALGVPVLGGFHKGMTETLFPHKSLHLDHVREIPTKINRLLEDDSLLSTLRPQVRSFVESKADVRKVGDCWKQAIELRPIRRPKLSRPYFIDGKIPLWILSKVLPGLTFGQMQSPARVMHLINRTRHKVAPKPS